jgi:hypothetical protein
MLREWIGLLVCVLIIGCAGQQMARAPKTTEAASPVSAMQADRESATALEVEEKKPEPPECTLPPPTEERDEAIELLLQDKPLEAVTRFEAILTQKAWDLASATLHVASRNALKDDNLRAALALRKGIKTVALEVPPRNPPRENKPIKATTDHSTTRLTRIAEHRNLITDDADWIAAHGPIAGVENRYGHRSHVAAFLGRQPLVRVFNYADHSVALYGEAFLVVSSPDKTPRAFLLALPKDPNRLESSPDKTSRAFLLGLPKDPNRLEITSARLVSDLLLVQLSYNGYASRSGGRNGYLAVYEIDSGRLRWMSPALSANANNFVVIGDSVITGYGFTAERDYLFNYDLKSGALLQKLPLRSAPNLFAVRDQRLFLRAYDMDYEFEISGAPTQSASDQTEENPVAVDANNSCLLRSAAAAIDARDTAALGIAVQGLSSRAGVRQSVLSVLKSMTLSMPGTDNAALADIWKIVPTRIAAPSWKRSVASPTRPLPTARAPKLVKKLSETADPVRALDEKPFRADQPSFIPPIEKGLLPLGAPRYIPSVYGAATLNAIIPSGERILLIYGGRYLVSLIGMQTETVFDLDALRHPPKANPQWKESAEQDATYAQIVDDTLYLCNGGGSYAREVYGKKGFISAIHLATGEIRWRSDPLRCNATFAIVGDYLAAGYGFTNEPDFLYLLRLADGKTVAKAKLGSGPDNVSYDNKTIHVEAYRHVYEFELR